MALSKDGLERLIARAQELDQERHGELDLARAREIAAELGVSRAAWDAALLEHQAAEDGIPLGTRQRIVRHLSAAVIGAVAGAGMARLGALTSGSDLVSGSIVVAISLGFALREIRRGAAGQPYLSLTTFWAAAALGLGVATQSNAADGLLFAGVSWAACSAAVAGMLRWMRRRG